MHKRSTKKQQLIRLTITYTLMVTAVILTVIALIFVTLGYQFNRKDGKLEQGGLVQFDSKPGGAKVTIDGNAFAFNTASKTTLTTGKHTVEFTRDGYITWKRDVYVRPSSVTWLNYARLIPNKLVSEGVVPVEGLSSSAMSPNRKAIIATQANVGNELQFIAVDTEKPKVTKLVLPADILTAHAVPAGATPHPASLSVVKWDKDNRYVLVARTYDPGQPAEWLVVDTRNAAASKNVSTLFGVKPSHVQFSIGNSRVLYGIVDGALRKMNLGDGTLSRPLVTNVEEYDQFDRATIVYETKLDEATKSRTVGYYTDNAQKSRTLKTYADDGQTPLRARVAKYYDERYFAYLYGDTFELFRGDLPSSDSTDTTTYKPIAQMTIPGGGDHMQFSDNGRYVVVQKANHFTTYDIEIGETYTKQIEGDARPDELRVLDDMTLASDRDGRIRTYEIDGLNPRDLGASLTGQAFGYSANDKYLYYFANDKSGVPTLTRVNLTVD